MDHGAKAVILLAVAFLYYLHRLNSRTEKSSTVEPPTIYPKIPLVSHVWNMIWGQFEYFVKLRNENPLPIYRLGGIPGANIYIVNSFELTVAVQRQPKSLSFKPIEATIGKRMTDWSDEAGEIVFRNLNGEDGDWGLSIESNQAVRNALAPGADLDAMNRQMIRDIAASLDKLQPGRNFDVETQTTELMRWIRHELTVATTNAVYGPQNPYLDRSVENAFWDYINGLTMLYVNFMPSVTARKGYRGRHTVTKAFFAYFTSNGHESGSAFTKDRYSVSRKHGVPIGDIAKFECGESIAALVNTVPAVFWMIYHVYATPLVLAELRQELSRIVQEIKDPNDGNTVRKVDLTQIKTSCPVLISTFQEVLRHRAMGTSVRQVMQDTLLDGKYLLKKDGIVQMPSRVVHTDPELWGPDVKHFHHRRFLKDNPEAARRERDGVRRFNPAALLAFGGGHTLCPGRHLATTEIMAAVVMFLLRYEVRPVSGRWAAPTCVHTNIAATIMEPDYDVPVRVEPRAGSEGVRWEFDLADSRIAYGIGEEKDA